MAALDWLLVYGHHFDVRVANLSLGKPISESNTTDPLVHAVEALWDSGVVTVVAAGNLGARGHMTVKSPGNSRKVITVGSLTDRDTGQDFTDDFVSSFSSRGPTAGDLVLKPDLVAPGNRIVAAIPTSSELVDRQRLFSRRGMEHVRRAGTSVWCARLCRTERIPHERRRRHGAQFVRILHGPRQWCLGRGG
jgi:serine protease AprX